MAELIGEVTTRARLELRGITKRFGSTVALDGVDATVAPGEVAALVGENGAGKSTLMNVLSGAVVPDAGTLRLDGADYEPRGPLEARRSGVAMVHQELALAPHLTVEQNLFLGVEIERRGLLDHTAMRERALAVLAELDHPELAPDVKVSTLPLAARQLVEIARALLGDARVLILDEPTSALTQNDVRTLMRTIVRLRARGLAIIYISHMLEEVRQIADTITVLRDGRSVLHGRSDRFSQDQIVHAMVGRTIETLYPRTPRTPGDVVLEVESLAAARLPRDASFTLRRGEILGIAGLAGAGRSELLRALYGLEPVRRGQVRTRAGSVAATPAARLEQGIGLLSEDRAGEGLALQRSLADNMTLSRLPTRWGLVAWERLRQAAAALVARLGIRCRGVQQRTGELSGGNQQKVALARLLHHDVDVLLLDEPTRGVDVGTRSDLYAQLDALVARHGKAIVWVSSSLPELFGMADRIAVMRRGTLLPARKVAEITEQQVLLDCVG